MRLCIIAVNIIVACSEWNENAPLPNPSDETTKHLTKLINYISQVITNPACGRGTFLRQRVEFFYPFRIARCIFFTIFIGSKNDRLRCYHGVFTILDGFFD